MHRVFRYDLTVPKDAEDQNGPVNNVEYLRWMQDAAMDLDIGRRAMAAPQ